MDQAADTRTDLELVEAFRRGQSAAFAALVRRHQPSVRRFLFGMLRGGPEDLSDLEQDVYAALLGALGSFRGEAAFSTFLFRLCRNKAVDFIRKETRRRRGLDGLLARLGVEAGFADPADELHAADQGRRCMRLLSRLSETERSLVLLKDIEGVAMDQLASVFGLPLGTVKSRLHRARRKLARWMEAENG